MTCSNALNSRGKLAVSPMSGSPTFDTGKKQNYRGEFKTPPCPTARRNNKTFKGDINRNSIGFVAVYVRKNNKKQFAVIAAEGKQNILRTKDK